MKKYEKMYYFILFLFIKIINKLFNIDNTSKITNNLYIGNIISSLNTNNFDIIINCTKEIPFFSNKINIRIPIDDNYIFKNYDTKNYFNLINKTLHKYKNKKILIHCRFGMQRSCFITQYILIKHDHYNLENSYKLIRSKRKISFLPYHNFKHIIPFI